MVRPMFLRRLSIDSLPGIEPGFIFEPPGEGLNIVTGPNAVGKSSLARALGYLLRDARADDPPGLILSAHLHSASACWTVRRNGSQILWTRDGEDASRPALPSAEQVGLYRLSVENLLASDRADAELARELRRRLQGGFDLQAPRIELGGRFGRNEEKALRRASAELRSVESRYSDLRREEMRLSDLAEHIDRAKSAREEASRLDLALSLLEYMARLAHCEARLGEFPTAIAVLRGDELERLAELEEKKTQLADELERRRGSLDKERRDLEKTGLARAQPAPEEMQTAERLLRELEERLLAWKSAQQSVEKADATRRDVIDEFEGTGVKGTGDPPKLDRESLGRVQEVVAPLLEKQHKRDELQRRIERAGTPPDDSEIERLWEGATALRVWLAVREQHASETARGGAGPARIGGWLGVAASAGAAVLAGIAVLAGMGGTENSGVTEGIGADGLGLMLAAMFSALAAALCSLVGLRIAKRRPSPAVVAARAAQSRFRNTGLTPPPDWTRDAVGEHLRTVIDKELRNLVRQRERAAQRESLEEELEGAEKKLAASEAARSALAEDLGFDPTLPLLHYDRYVALCRRLDQARGEWEAQKAKGEHLAGEIDKLVGGVAGFFGGWRRKTAPHPSASDLDSASASDSADSAHPAWIGNDRNRTSVLLRETFDDLRNRLQEANRANNAIDGVAADIQSLQGRVADIHGEIEALYGRVDLQPDDRALLEGLVDQLDDWREARDARERAKGFKEQVHAQLREHPNLIELATAGATGELQALLQDAKQRADQHTGLVEQRSSIETKLRDAGKDSVLEKSIAAEAQARETLVDRRDKAFLSRATEVLLDDVETAFRSEHEPGVLRRAKALFAEATGHEFSLELRPDDSFVARNNKQGLLRTVEELSSGTRMQLLLALRLAWTEALEQGGETLPLFLDEALTTSDEGRFKAIAEALERLADAQNRQIFYLAARRHEAVLWREVTGRQPPVVDLAEVRFTQTGRTLGDYRIERPEPTAAPEGRTAEEYALLLGVPRIDPRLSAESLHLFHLLRDDLRALHCLIDGWRILSLGQLESLLGSNAAASALADEDMRHRLSQRCAAFRAWIELWRQGRGRPIDRGALEQSGTVSSIFIDATAELAKELEGDGRALIEALRTGGLRGFRSGKTNELESWLMERGFLDKQPILAADDRHRLTVRQLAPAMNADLDDINTVIGWFEGGSDSHVHTSQIKHN